MRTAEKRAAAGRKGMRIANARMFAAGEHPSQKGTSGFHSMSREQRISNGQKSAKHPNNPFSTGVAGKASAASPNASYKQGKGILALTSAQKAEAGRKSSQKVYTCCACGRSGRGNSMKYHVDKKCCQESGYRFSGKEQYLVQVAA